ncbi:MAG: VOC family protein [Anaerolineae bacterium]|nr:MAG: glyoxalase/bleomycin resistance/extradiol dioxygenase family protein [Anaerolineae bacterium]MCL4878636.1 VOC family protein [Anaerolineae bacterium]
MRIEHVALWTHQLEVMRDFYVEFFGGKSSEKYHNPQTGFESYFISFTDGARLELMQMPGIPRHLNALENQATGYIHIAIATGSKDKVNTLTEKLRQRGYRVIGEPRTTGDGYYESVILDPDENRIELTT